MAQMMAQMMAGMDAVVPWGVLKLTATAMNKWLCLKMVYTIYRIYPTVIILMYGTFDTENPMGKTMINPWTHHPLAGPWAIAWNCHSSSPSSWWACHVQTGFILGSSSERLPTAWKLRRRTLWTLCNLAPASRNMKLVLLAFNRVGPCTLWNVAILSLQCTSAIAVSSMENGASLQESLGHSWAPENDKEWHTFEELLINTAGLKRAWAWLMRYATVSVWVGIYSGTHLESADKIDLMRNCFCSWFGSDIHWLLRVYIVYVQ